MNRSELETLIRQVDPAAGHAADPALQTRILALTADAPTDSRPVLRRRGPLVAVAVFAVMVAVVLVPGLLLNRPAPVPLASSIDGATFLVRYGNILGGIRGVATDGGRVWAMSPGEQTLFEIPFDGGDIIEHEIGFYAEGVRLLGGAIWLEGWDPDQIIRYVPGEGLFGQDEITRIPLPGQMRHFGIIVGDELWNSAGDALVRIAGDGNLIDIREGAEIGALATGFGSVWAGGTDGSLQRLDPESGTVFERFDIADVQVGGILEGPVSLWVMDRAANTVVSVLPTTGQVLSRVELGGRPRSMARVGKSIWVSTFESTLVEIDATTGDLLRTVAMRAAPGFLFPVGDQLGVSLFRSAEIALIDVSQPMLEVPPGPINDQLVELGSGHAVRLRCVGAGSPTVVLEANMGEGVESWATVQAMLGAQYRVCASERSGLWMADQYPQAASAEEAATDLRQALEAGGEAGPFLLIGDGVGSWVSQAFAAGYPDEVLGMVLVDPQPDDFLERFTELAPEEMVRSATAGFLEGNENTRLRITVGNPAGVPVTIIARDSAHSPFAWIGDQSTVDSIEAAWSEGLVSMAQLLGAELVTANGIPHIIYDAPQIVVDQLEALIR